MATRKYQVYKKQVSYDGGDTWEDVLPVETVKMPVYGETCKVDYAAEVWVDCHNKYMRDGIGSGARKLPPMDILTERYVSFLIDGASICPGLFIGTGVTEVASSAFTNYRGSKETVHFEEPSSVRTIRNKAFFAHPYREVIRIPDSVETIENYAFATSGYTSLRYVEIGSGCTYIGSSAFADIATRNPGSDKGRVFKMKGSTPPQLGGENPFSRNHQNDGYTIIVPENALSSYRTAWESISGNVITDTALGNSAKAETNMCRIDDGKLYPSVQQFPNDGRTTLTFSDLTGGTTCWFISWLKIGDSVKTLPTNAFASTNIAYLNLGNGVEEIGQGAFSNLPYLRDLNIPDSVKTIGTSAFNSCSNLKNVRIGSGVTSIMQNAFQGCGLTNLEISNNVEYIGDNAFCNCRNLKIDDNFKLPEAVSYIGNNAFKVYSDDKNVYTLKRFEIPTGIDTIGNNALERFQPAVLEICGNPTNIGSGICSPSIAVAVGALIPPTVMRTSDETHGSIIDNIAKIGWMKTALIFVQDEAYDAYREAYGWCYLRQHMYRFSEIGNILDFANGYKFCGLYDREGSTVSPYSTNKEQGLFKYGEYDGSTTLTSGETTWRTSYTTRIPDMLWVGDNVEYVDNNVGIGPGTLSDTRVVIFGTGLKRFNYIGGNDAIYIFKSSTPPEFDCSNNKHTFSIFYVPDDAIDTYREWLARYNVHTYRKGIGDEGCSSTACGNYTYIPTDDFNVRPISEILQLSDNVKKKLKWVDAPGQYGCSGTSKITMEKEQLLSGSTWVDTGKMRPGDEIVERFSYDCGYTGYDGKLRGTRADGLSTVEINCNASTTLTTREVTGSVRTNLIQYVEVGNCTKDIDYRAFSGCNRVNQVVLSNGVETIGMWAFNGLTGLTSCTIGNGATTIEYGAFSGCTSLSNLVIPDNVILIGKDAFANTPWWRAYSADTGNQYNNVIYINNVAYKPMTTDITSCTFKEGTKGIGGSAFYQCNRLADIVIPDSVVAIGDSCFSECGGLTSCTIGSGVTTIGSGAFTSCRNLTGTLEIPASVTFIGSGAFYYCSYDTVIARAVTPPTMRDTAFEDNVNFIYVPAESVDVYKESPGWNYFADKIFALP